MPAPDIFSGTMLLGASASECVVALDRPSLAAGAPPREADAAQAPAAQNVVSRLEPHRPHDNMVTCHSGEPTA